MKIKVKYNFDRKEQSVTVSIRGDKEFTNEMKRLVKNLNILIPKLPEVVDTIITAVKDIKITKND